MKVQVFLCVTACSCVLMLSQFEPAVSESFVPAAARAELVRHIPDLGRLQIDAMVPTESASSIVVIGKGQAHTSRDEETITEAEFTFSARLKARCGASRQECYRADWLSIEGTVATGVRS